MRRACLILVIAFLSVFLLPICVAAGLHFADGSVGRDWRDADRSSAGLLPPATANQPAVIRIFGARTVRWRGIFASHCWIVVKPAGATAYTRYDYTAWGSEPIRVNGFEADGRWFGRDPEVIFALDGEGAASLIPRIEATIRAYAYSKQGDYRAWPGPNSNTFVAAILDAVPEIDVTLPAIAIGKDYPYDGRWLRLTPSGTGLRLSLGGYAGLTIGWHEGFEINILGAVAGLDIRRPAIELPGLGRFGV
ncbi:MAG: DUF3750 domain-containing protein [Dongiaceae bacterium]